MIIYDYSSHKTIPPGVDATIQYLFSYVLVRSCCRCYRGCGCGCTNTRCCCCCGCTPSTLLLALLFVFPVAFPTSRVSTDRPVRRDTSRSWRFGAIRDDSSLACGGVLYIITGFPINHHVHNGIRAARNASALYSCSSSSSSIVIGRGGGVTALVVVSSPHIHTFAFTLNLSHYYLS